jgi:hypothetical protein
LIGSAYRFRVRHPSHHTEVVTGGEGRAQAVCSCGWASEQYGSGKDTGTMDALQLAKDAGDLHVWETSLEQA